MDQYQTVKAVADRLGVSGETVRRWAATGILPAPIRLGRRILFRVSDLQAFETRTATSGAAR